MDNTITAAASILRKKSLNESIEFSISPGEKIFGLYDKNGNPVNHAGSSVFGANSLKGILAHYSDQGAYMKVLALPKGSSYTFKNDSHSVKHLTDTEAKQVFEYYKTASVLVDSVASLLVKSDNKIFTDTSFARSLPRL